MLHPSEARARREVLQLALKRLVTSPHKQFQRSELFASPSPQSNKKTWQREVLRTLIVNGLIHRYGLMNSTACRYGLSDSIDAVPQLTAYVYNPKTLDQLWRRAEDPSELSDDLPEIFTENLMTPPLGEESIAEPTSYEILQTLLRLVYGVSEAVIHLRDRFDEFDRRLQRLESLWFEAPAPPAAEADSREALP